MKKLWHRFKCWWKGRNPNLMGNEIGNKHLSERSPNDRE